MAQEARDCRQSGAQAGRHPQALLTRQPCERSRGLPPFYGNPSTQPGDSVRAERFPAVSKKNRTELDALQKFTDPAVIVQRIEADSTGLPPADHYRQRVED